MNIADAIRVAILHLTSSTGRTTLCYDRLGDLLCTDSSELFHFPSVIDTNLLAMGSTFLVTIVLSDGTLSSDTLPYKKSSDGAQVSSSFYRDL